MGFPTLTQVHDTLDGGGRDVPLRGRRVAGGRRPRSPRHGGGLPVKSAGARAGRTTNREGGMRTVAAAVAGGISIVACVGAGCAQAAEIRMLVSNAVKTSLEVLVPEFEKAAEHKLVITFGAASELKTEIDKGAAFDVAILTPAAIDALT